MNYIVLISTLLLIKHSSATELIETDWIGECPKENGKVVVHLPHSSNCTKFFKCDHSVPVPFDCPDKLHFNPILEVCDWPQTAGCEPGTGTTTQSIGDCEDLTTTCSGSTTTDGTPGSGGEETTTPGSGGQETTTPGSGGQETTTPGSGGEETTTPGSGGEETTTPGSSGPETTTPGSGGEETTTPGDGGQETTTPGSGGEETTTPGSGGEETTTPGSGGEETTTPGSSEPETTTPGSSGPETTTPGSGGEETTTPGNGGQETTTPESGGEDTTTPGNGGPETTTPGSDGQETTTPGNGGEETTTPGSGGQETTTPGSGGEETTTPGSGGPETTTPGSDGQETTTPGSGGEETTTPGSGGQETTTPGSGGEETTTPGSGGPETTTPGSGGQETTTPGSGGEETTTPGSGGQETTTPGSGGEETTPGSGGQDTTTPGGSGGSTGGWNGVCPEENGEYVVHLPHETDCTKFYKCDWGKPILQQCPDGLHFNPTLEVCDWPEDAGCKDNGGEITTPGNGGEETTTPGNGGEETTTPGNGGQETTTPGGSGGSTGGWNGVCPEENGEYVVHLPHETDCTKFYKCDWGKPILQQCPDGLHFNPTLEVCDWPEDAGCKDNGGEITTPGNGGQETTTPGGNGGSTSGWNGVCPEENGEYVVHLPHETDCTKFYKCDWGKPILQQCPDGLHFNPTLEVCDWPEDAGCKDNGGEITTPGNGGEEITTPGNGGEETTTPGNGGQETTTPGGSGGSTGGWNGVCSEENGEYVVHLPHETDCTKFYKCDWGEPILQQCPDGLHFNPTLEVCDWPEDAGCKDNGGEITTPGNGGEETTTPGNGGQETTTPGNGGQETTTPGGNGGSTGGWNGVCPEENGEYVVHLPHESDCTKFYKCDWGKPILQQCPDGLHFNPTLEVCDWPEDAGCKDNGGEITTPGNGGEETTTPGNGGQETTTPGGNGGSTGGWNGVCPEENGEYVVHLPHETDCTKFYKCDWGKPILQQCPDGLHFNPTLEVCDWPEDAGCKDNGGEITTPGNGGEEITTPGNGGEETTTPGNGGQETTTPGGSGGSTGGWNGVCPEENGEYVVHLPHETDCTKFYKCDWGEPILQQCPDGLHFNPTLEVCDWPEDAGCKDNGGEITTPGNGGEETTTPGNGGQETTTPGNGGQETTTPGGNGGSTGGWNGVCPEENGEYVVHLPHESDCTKFYKCDWGKPILQQCPDGLHFNPTLEVCDWPEDAGCKDNGGEITTPGNGGEETTTPGNGGEETTTPGNGGQETTTPGGNGGSTGGWNGVCPEENGEYVVHLPHETDCTKFYKCDWGKPILQQCPDGLHFNPTLEVCDWPEDAGCKDNGGEITTPGNGGEETTTPGNGGEETTTPGNGGQETTTPGGSGGSTGGWNSVCPEENGEYVVHLPHETDCTKFYKCDWGKPILQQCPDGLHFNPTLEVCDWPEDAGCKDNGGEITTPGNGGEETTTPGNGGEETTTPGNGGQETTTPGGSGGSTDGWNGVCPEENGEYVVHLPHETDCTKFYKCDWGKPILQQCPDGLHFNPTLEVCDWPADAGCKDNGGEITTPGNGGEETTTPGNGGEETTTPGNGGEETTTLENSGEETTTPGGSGGSTGGWNGVCPEENSEYVVHLPHETDCTKFYKCDWGKPILQQCPDGLHFNPTLEVCDWPADAGCKDNGGEITTPGNGGEETTTPGNGGEETTTLENGGEETTTPGGSGGSTGGWNGVCPEEDSEYVVHLPHETDCTKFYKCDWGKPILQQCPDGLHFNPTLEVCDWPADAGCKDNGGEITTPGNGGEETTTPGNGGEETTTPGNGGQETTTPGGSGGSTGGWNGVCPEENGEYVVYLPHETDCTKFYKCDWGKPILQQCPDGLHFNPTLEVCDWPADAGCKDNGGEITTPGSGGEETTTPGSGGQETTTPGGNGGSTGGWNGVCPEENGEYVVHLPHETDCTKFYKCDWGKPILQQCPDGLHFNPTLEVCDWPADAGCEDNGGEITTPGSGGQETTTPGSGGEETTTPGGSGQDTTTPGSGGEETTTPGSGGQETTTPGGNGADGGKGYCETLGCPEINGKYVYFLPHPTDCRRFCKCDWGEAYEFICPANLHFNPNMEVCDYPADAGCAGEIAS